MYLSSSYLYTSSAGYRWLGHHLASLSTPGLIFLSALTGIAISATVLSGKWYPSLILHLTSGRIPGIKQAAIPAMGAYIPAILFFLLLPLSSVFSNDKDTWWIFLTAGLLASALTAYYAIGIRRISIAIIYTGQEYFLSGRAGLGKWKATEEIKGLTATRETYWGTTVYRLSCLDGRERRKLYGYLPISEFSDAGRSLIIDFVRNFTN